MAAPDGAFGDLRKLADWFSTSPAHASIHVSRLTRRLGATCVPLLGRELRSPDPRRREAARDCLAQLAAMPASRARVIAELRGIVDTTGPDEVKVCALGLLAELGEHAEAHFADPHAMQRRSALALAAQLETAADVANAADMMVRQLAADDVVQMIEILAESAPPAAQCLARELTSRLDLDADVRERIESFVTAEQQASPARRAPRPTQIAVLVDAAARIVVVASRKLSGERRWRRWAVLIGPSGLVEDCLHEEASPAKHDGADADAAPLVAGLVSDGYRVASTDLDHARTIVAAAARLTASRHPGRHDPCALGSAYYLGRDLLELGDAHLGPRRDPTTLALARAVELLAEGEVTRALALLERTPVPSASADHAAAVAACALAHGRHADAIEPLGRAIAIEPAWPLHHWNLAVAYHTLGDAQGCYHALRRFVATSARPTALHGDPDQPARIACAERMLGELERAARLAGTSLARRRRTKRTSPKPRAARTSD